MARLESISVGGYYPTPPPQVPRIAALLQLPEQKAPKTQHLVICDPCAGDGAAIRALAVALAGGAFRDQEVDFFTCELEESRHEELQAAMKQGGRSGYGWKNGGGDRCLHGDAFRVTFEPGRKPGCGLLYLNPPYDTDRVYGRLEEKFLVRFARALMPGGVLVFVVPHYALAASADTLARAFKNVTCHKFAGDDYNAYKQVVLIAERNEVELFDPDPAILAQVNGWAASVEGMPELPEPLITVDDLDKMDEALEPVHEFPDAPSGDECEESFEKASDRRLVPLCEGYTEGFESWTMRSIDVKALLDKWKPWHETTRARGLVPFARVLPDMPVVDLMHRTYEVAMPPRPAHIAAGIAAGLFNGQRIEPNDRKAKLPDLLVKGVFDREWRTVEEKHNKDGDKTGEVQVQQPKLVVTILDLAAHKYHTVAATTAESKGQLDVSKMGIADLLKHYGQALMGVMERQCVILYDKRRDKVVPIESAPRPLYTAQAEAVKACVTLLRERSGRWPILLGEIGSGKTSVALVTAKSVGAKCILAICPPHLLDSWKNEVKAVLPTAHYIVLESVTDLDEIGHFTEDDVVVAVLSRETAKLSHGWEGVGSTCPKCGLDTPHGVDLAKKRARCEQKTLVAKDDYAVFARRLALQLRPYTRDSLIKNVLRGRLDAKMDAKRATYGLNAPLPAFPGLTEELVLALRSRLAVDCLPDAHGYGGGGDEKEKALFWSFMATPNPDHLIKFVAVGRRKNDWTNRIVEKLPLLLRGDEAALDRVRAVMQCWPKAQSYSTSTPLQDLERSLANESEDFSERLHVFNHDLTWKNGVPHLDKIASGSVEAAMKLFECVMKVGQWGWTAECGEPLFGAVPQPRRVALSQYIVNYHKKLFDFLIIDEGHEYATDGSAQERAAHRLTTLQLPTVFMTGSLMNGYAASLHANMWALSPEYREEFERGDVNAFCDRYGYRKRIVQDRAEGEVVTFGTQSDRVERSERDTGHAPGVLPLFLFRHLLPSAVTLHKADLRIDLPLLTQEPVPVLADDLLHAEYARILKALVQQIKADRFSKDGLAGKLFGALSELPSFLDRATSDVGNSEDGSYEIRYPESCGGDLVVAAKMLSPKVVLPKEEWLLGEIERELGEGRRVMVFGWHLGILPRLQRLIEARTGEQSPILWADKVPTAKRQGWIDREIVAKKRRVMIANPVAIQTGLNNLVHFHTELWHENPACNPLVYRQAVGRIDRIGAKLPTRVRLGYYDNSLQKNMYDLLMAKVAISTATDGLDPESALRASGIVEDEYLTGLSIGKQLWAMLTAEEGDAPIAKKRKWR